MRTPFRPQRRVGNVAAVSERERLRAENAELKRRLEIVDAELLMLRDEALARRSEVRQLAESLPTAVSRRALVAQMTKDAIGHPDKTGIASRAIRKLARAPRRLVHALGFGPKALPPGDPVATGSPPTSTDAAAR